MRTVISTGIIASILMFSVGAPAQQQPPLVKQFADGDPPTPLSAEELAALGDPFFNLVLRTRLDVTSLTQIEDVIQPARSGRRLFVVSEHIADPAPGSRRAVMTFTGQNDGQTLDSNVMLSVFFDDRGFEEGRSPIEAMGWDDSRGRYNYYKLDDSHTSGRLTWKFRGSSEDADTLTPRSRAGTCMACHTNGAPIMKELLFPWTNWHSFKFQAAYLTRVGMPHWRVSTSPRIAQSLGSAETLETTIIDSVKRFNRRQIERHVASHQNERFVVTSGRRLLRPLFFTTEINIITAQNESGLHPLRRPMSGHPGSAVAIPNSVFLNANLISGGTAGRYQGLGIVSAQEFSRVASVTPAEYVNLVRESGVKLGDVLGDALFAWIAPEASHIDIDHVDQLIRRGIITPQFAAAVLSVDLENPILSAAREGLLEFLPDTFSFAPVTVSEPVTTSRHPDELTRKVIMAIEQKALPRDSAAGRFLERLLHGDPVKALAADIEAYHARVRTALNDPQSRGPELRRLYSLTLARRVAVLKDPTLGRLDETQGLLFPVR